MCGFFKGLKKSVTKPKAKIEMTLDKTTIGLGDILRGKLYVTSEEDFDAQVIRAEIICQQKIPKGTDLPEYKTHYSDRPVASEALHIPAGFEKEFPFSTQMPSKGHLTYGNITWTIKGVIDIKGRPDITSKETRLFVIKGSDVVPGAESQKIVTEDELETYMAQGWVVHTVLPSGKIIIKRE